MKTPMVREHNVETGEIIDREMNAQELTQYEKEQEEAALAVIKQSEADVAKAEATAKLEALGLTADDLKALGL